jgi:3-deoxy-D-manno-octulosonate 8-phosphate phosphatase (KDO 8-P phosphatase)
VEQQTLTRVKEIKLLVLDVDGVLTDGGLYYGTDGEILKKFHVHDGAGIKALLKAGIQVAVISSRHTPAVDIRMDELGVSNVLQGAQNKLDSLNSLVEHLGIKLNAVACIGDDVADIPMMRCVGLAVAVANARQQVKKCAHYSTSAKGGHGAVREICDLLLVAR